jgi:hypothetical protein
MKYKICKLIDGNGREWYQIKKKGWILWNWVCDSHFETEIEFSTEQSAKEYIEKQLKYVKSTKIKLLECVEV